MVAGGLIGVERTYHGHPAGFRTHILVCLTSCLLMLAAMQQSTWAFTAPAGQTVVIDPTRMSHGLLTGIGFLCAGVIFREGFSVHGLTTAASLWVTSAIGVLYGVGMMELALIGSAATLGVLGMLRLLDARLPHVGVMDVTLRWKRGEAPSGLAVRDLLRAKGVKVVRLGHVMSHDGAIHEHHLKVKGHVPIDVDGLVSHLGDQSGLAGFSILPREE
ncbi:MAG: MgtC/SapB family protein [Alphaproteobacteria bacterium]|nr:MgtC/SapB family protein [Alphaproteobacteria bacterium]MBU4136516.1 MgtC/SapB family protein [Alphaproteobacteria bacterium]